jgi:hypothetical protein
MKDDTLLKSERVALQGAEDFLARGDVKNSGRREKCLGIDSGIVCPW